MKEYYLALKGCSRYLQKCSMLEVDKEKKDVGFYRGFTKDKFAIDENGKPFCENDFYNGDLEYKIIGPLTDKEFEKVIDWDFGDFTPKRRIRISKLPFKIPA